MYPRSATLFAGRTCARPSAAADSAAPLACSAWCLPACLPVGAATYVEVERDGPYSLAEAVGVSSCYISYRWGS